MCKNVNLKMRSVTLSPIFWALCTFIIETFQGNVCEWSALINLNCCYQVDIWEERRVFGSRAKSLRDLMLGEDVPPPLELNKKRSRSVRIVKRDSRSIRTVQMKNL